MSIQDGQLLLIKKETTPGTDALPVNASDGILAIGLGFTPGIDTEFPEYEQGFPGNFDALAVGATGKLKFDCPAFQPTSLGVAEARLSALMGMSGHTETVTAGVSVAYAQGAPEPATAYYNRGGFLHKHVYCVSDFGITVEAGKQVKFNFPDMAGRLYSKTDVALAAVTGLIDKTMRGESLGFTMNGVSFVCDKLTFKANNKPVEKEDIGSPDGLLGFDLDRSADPTIEVSIEMPLTATADVWGWYENKTQIPLVLDAIGVGGTMSLSCGQVIVNDLKEKKVGNTLYADLSLACLCSSGEDAYSILFA